MSNKYGLLGTVDPEDLSALVRWFFSILNTHVIQAMRGALGAVEHWCHQSSCRNIELCRDVDFAGRLCAVSYLARAALGGEGLWTTGLRSRSRSPFPFDDDEKSIGDCRLVWRNASLTHT